MPSADLLVIEYKLSASFQDEMAYTLAHAIYRMRW